MVFKYILILLGITVFNGITTDTASAQYKKGMTVAKDGSGDPANEMTAYYAEFNSKGPGASPDRRVGWSHQFTKSQAKKYRIKIFLVVGSRRLNDNRIFLL